MQIVIEMDKEDFELLKSVKNTSVLMLTESKAVLAVKTGTPLPEHHSDLIERDALRNKMWKDNVEGYAAVYLEDIDNAPTIIPATKEERQSRNLTVLVVGDGRIHEQIREFLSRPITEEGAE